MSNLGPLIYIVYIRFRNFVKPFIQILADLSTSPSKMFKVNGLYFYIYNFFYCSALGHTIFAVFSGGEKMYKFEGFPTLKHAT